VRRLLAVATAFILVGMTLIGAHLVSRLEAGTGHGLTLLGGLLTISGLILGFGSMAMLLLENAYLLIREEGLLFHENGKETTIAWSDLDGVRLDGKVPGFLDFDRRGAKSFRWFAGKTAKDILGRVEEAKRKALHGLLRSE
jgi:hypothetical protein